MTSATFRNFGTTRAFRTLGSPEALMDYRNGGTVAALRTFRTGSGIGDFRTLRTFTPPPGLSGLASFVASVATFRTLMTLRTLDTVRTFMAFVSFGTSRTLETYEAPAGKYISVGKILNIPPLSGPALRNLGRALFRGPNS